MARYTNLKISAPNRLAILKRDAEQFNSKYNPDTPKTWRDMRYSKLTSDNGLSQGLNSGEPIWYCHSKESMFRRERDAEDINSRLERGWYTDTEGNETAIGIVASLPHGRFLAGYRWTGNDERVYYPEIFDDEDDAARCANSHAESFAETAREDAYQYQQCKELESEEDDKLHRLKECIAMRHIKCMAYVRDEITELIERIKEIRDTLSTDYKEYR